MQRLEQSTEIGSKFNPCEARIIEQQLESLEADLRGRESKKGVAIITGYSAQVDLLERTLDVRDENRWQALDIEINTVDAFQGREQDIVFYSVVRSNNRNEIGFLSDARRLNVALSRGRELLFIVGDHRMVASAFSGGINPFREVIAHIAGNPNECKLVEANQ